MQVYQVSVAFKSPAVSGAFARLIVRKVVAMFGRSRFWRDPTRRLRVVAVMVEDLDGFPLAMWGSDSLYRAAERKRQEREKSGASR